MKARNFKNTFTISFSFKIEFKFKFSKVFALDDDGQSIISVNSSMLLFDFPFELNLSWSKPMLQLSLCDTSGLLLRQSQYSYLFESIKLL